MEKKNNEVLSQPQCPKCGSKTIVYRKRADEYLCRRCGELFPKK